MKRVRLSSLPSSETLRAEICIVGSGAAGIAMACRLKDAGKSVLLIEGGTGKYDRFSRDLYRGTADPAGSHEPTDENRQRRWGGTTTVWGGRLVPFDPVDFQRRDFVPLSGWPVTAEELAPYYRQATACCEAGAPEYDAAAVFGEDEAEMIQGLDGEGILSRRLERWSPPTDFGKRYRRELEASPHVRILTGADCVGFEPSAEGGRVEGLILQGRDGKARTVRAGHYVLAAGCLESTRLMLCADRTWPGGLGSRGGWLGSCYMSHVQGTYATIELAEGAQVRHVFQRDEEGVYCRRRFGLSEERQIRERMLNVIGFFFRPEDFQDHFNDPLLSALYLAKLGKRLMQTPGSRRLQVMREEKVRAWKHLFSSITGSGRAGRNLSRLVTTRLFARHRLPFVVPAGSSTMHLFFSSEQAPHRESRLMLGEETDAHGMPRLQVRIRFDELDRTSILRFHEILQARFARSGAGRMSYDPAGLEAFVNRKLSSFNSGAHHLGGTRMAASADEGVVDAHCRVHGVENLHVASSSVFPTGSHANPTLTIVALALRLADRLRTVA